jgi:hypothetical protein
MPHRFWKSFVIWSNVSVSRQRHFDDVVESGQEFDPFDVALETVAPMPTDDLVLIGVRLFPNAVVKVQRSVLALNGADERFGQSPQIGTGFGLFPKQPGYLVVANLPVQQSGQTRRGRRAKGANQ